MGAQAGSGQSKLTLEAIYTPHVKNINLWKTGLFVSSLKAHKGDFLSKCPYFLSRCPH